MSNFLYLLTCNKILSSDKVVTIADWYDDAGRAGLQCPGQEQEGLHHRQGADEAHQEVVKGRVDELDGQGHTLKYII